MLQASLPFLAVPVLYAALTVAPFFFIRTAVF